MKHFLLKKPVGLPRLQPKFIGGFIKKAGDFLFGKITQRVKNFLRDHGTEQITSLELGRTPIQGALNTALDVVSGGGYSESMKKQGFDKFFHLFLIVNGKYRFEKNQTVSVENYTKKETEENQSVPTVSLSINDFLKKGIDRVGEEDFWQNYQALNQNCQWWIKNLLQANNIYSDDIDKFVYQDVTQLRSDIQGTSDVANEITDLASGLDKLISYVSDGKSGLKRGGLVGNPMKYKKKYLV
jgi:hypothetical protein